MPNPLEMNAAENNQEQVQAAPRLPNANALTTGAIDLVNSELERLYKQSADYDSIKKWADENDYNFNSESADYLYNQFFTEKNNATAWERTLQADSTKYQRAVDDMKKAGLNPFLLMSSGGSSPSASAGSIGSGSIASQKNAKTQANTQLTTSILSLLATVGGAALFALLM